MIDLYDTIGVGYGDYRRPDSRIQSLIDSALGDSRSVLNVGAGTGSYEPADRPTVAVEPSPVMIRQRPSRGNPVVQASADALPFADNSFSASLAVLTVHHWPDRERGLSELVRVASDRVVVLSHDGFHESFWLMEYFPEILDIDEKIMPSHREFETTLGSYREIRVPIPFDCTDCFLATYWRRPHRYLEAGARNAISAFAMIEKVEEGVGRLSDDLASGAWHERHGHLLGRDSMDLGYKLVVADLAC